MKGYEEETGEFLRRRNLKRGVMSRSLTVDFILFLFFHFILFFFSFFFFSIFRTARVRVDWSHCHISHKLMAKSQD